MTTTSSTLIPLTPRSRHALRDTAESMRVQAWFVQEAIDNDALDADEAIKRLSLIISQAKDLDRKIKARRRQAQKNTLHQDTLAIWDRDTAEQAEGLDFSDPEDRAIFRSRLTYELRLATIDIARGLAQHWGADKTGRSRDEAIRAAADAYMTRCAS